MQPGIHRAVPMGVIGFIVGALIVVLIRGVQGLEPLWDAEIGMIVAAFTTSGFFIWGLGAFDPAMNVHAHEPDEEHALVEAGEDAAEESAEEGEPRTVLGFTVWEVAFWTVVMLIVLGALVAFPTGLNLRVSSDPAAAFEQVGYHTIQLPFGGPELQVSQLTLFVGFVIFTLLSLAVAGGLIGVGWLFLTREVTVAKSSEPTPLETEPDEPIVRARDPVHIALAVVRFVVLFAIFYALFFYVLIGLVIPQPRWLLIALSVVNALVVTILILYPHLLLRVVGRLAGSLAHVLRELPEALR